MAVFTIAWGNNAEQAVAMKSAKKTPSTCRNFVQSIERNECLGGGSIVKGTKTSSIPNIRATKQKQQ